MDCEWKQEDYDSDVYKTSCGHHFAYESGEIPPVIKFCCYCGGNLVAIPYKDEEDND